MNEAAIIIELELLQVLVKSVMIIAMYTFGAVLISLYQFDSPKSVMRWVMLIIGMALIAAPTLFILTVIIK